MQVGRLCGIWIMPQSNAGKTPRGPQDMNQSSLISVRGRDRIRWGTPCPGNSERALIKHICWLYLCGASPELPVGEMSCGMGTSVCMFLCACIIQSCAGYFQLLIFPNKRRKQAHKTQQWIDKQLCIYIEFPGNKACAPTSLPLFRGKLCFAFPQCPRPNPVCPPNLN